MRVEVTTEIFIEETLPQNMYVVILCLCMAISIEVSDLHVQFLKKIFSFTFFKQARKSSFSQLFLPTLKRSNLLVFIFIFIFIFFFFPPPKRLVCQTNSACVEVRFCYVWCAINHLVKKKIISTLFQENKRLCCTTSKRTRGLIAFSYITLWRMTYCVIP